MTLGRSSWSAAAGPVPENLDPAERLSKELSEEDRKLVDWIADQVVSRRMTAPAVFVLESVKPMNYVSSQLLVVLAPMLGVFIPKVTYDRLVGLLEKRPFIELLLRSVESREDEFLSQQRAKKEEARAAKKAGTSPK